MTVGDLDLNLNFYVPKIAFFVDRISKIDILKISLGDLDLLLTFHDAQNACFVHRDFQNLYLMTFDDLDLILTFLDLKMLFLCI